MRITGTRHEYGTADVRVETNATLSAPSLASGRAQVIVPNAFYIDDEHQAGQWWLTIVADGPTVNRDGSLAARTVRVAVPRSDVPAEVREALAAMRPDLADWLRDA